MPQLKDQDKAQPKKYALTINRLDPGLHRAWKAECLMQGITMETGVLAALELWIAANIQKRQRERQKGGDNK